ncbi:MAG: hypothetical protein K6G46_11235 [Prevotella sp.]|nr:hypothetical protein [Prevotella sp.]
MNYRICIMAMAVLTLAWGCTSDSESGEKEPTLQNSEFAASEKPTWTIDWLWTDQAPTWQEPNSSDYWCSMQIQVILSDELTYFASNDDLMAVFINGTCRSVSNPNILADKGEVVFLMNIEGDENEVGQKMQLQYYSAQLKHLFTNNNLPTFEPNNLWGNKYHLTETPSEGNSKYPFVTELQVTFSNGKPPFTPGVNDIIGVFVDGQCRGVIKYDSTIGIKGLVFSRIAGENAQLRYYSSANKGIYTFKQTFTLNNERQSIAVAF